MLIAQSLNRQSTGEKEKEKEKRKEKRPKPINHSIHKKKTKKKKRVLPTEGQVLLTLLLHLIIYIHGTCIRLAGTLAHFLFVQFSSVTALGLMAMTTFLIASRSSIVRVMAVIGLDTE